jgi:hypothetical protein
MQVTFLGEEVDKYIKFLQVGSLVLELQKGNVYDYCSTDMNFSPSLICLSCPSLWPQAVDRETETADHLHAQERLHFQSQVEEYERQITEWKVKCFDEQYERYADIHCFTRTHKATITFDIHAGNVLGRSLHRLCPIRVVLSNWWPASRCEPRCASGSPIP